MTQMAVSVTNIGHTTSLLLMQINSVPIQLAVWARHHTKMLYLRLSLTIAGATDCTTAKKCTND